MREIANAIGTGQSDPYNRGSLAYRKYWLGESSKSAQCTIKTYFPD